MRCDHLALRQRWILGWRGMGITFEVVPVLPGPETSEIVAPLLPPPDPLA